MINFEREVFRDVWTIVFHWTSEKIYFLFFFIFYGKTKLKRLYYLNEMRIVLTNYLGEKYDSVEIL